MKKIKLWWLEADTQEKTNGIFGTILAFWAFILLIIAIAAIWNPTDNISKLAATFGILFGVTGVSWIIAWTITDEY